MWSVGHSENNWINKNENSNTIKTPLCNGRHLLCEDKPCLRLLPSNQDFRLSHGVVSVVKRCHCTMYIHTYHTRIDTDDNKSPLGCTGNPQERVGVASPRRDLHL